MRLVCHSRIRAPCRDSPSFVVDDVITAVLLVLAVCFMIMTVLGAGKGSVVLLRRSYVWLTFYVLMQVVLLLVRRSVAPADLRSQTASQFYHRAAGEYTCFGWSVDAPDTPEPEGRFDREAICHEDNKAIGPPSGSGETMMSDPCTTSTASAVLDVLSTLIGAVVMLYFAFCVWSLIKEIEGQPNRADAYNDYGFAMSLPPASRAPVATGVPVTVAEVTAADGAAAPVTPSDAAATPTQQPVAIANAVPATGVAIGVGPRSVAVPVSSVAEVSGVAVGRRMPRESNGVVHVGRAVETGE